jgi:predicted dehydrogenase
VVATGSIAQSVVQDLTHLADADLYAVSSRNQATADAFAATYGFAKAYGDDDGGP